MKMRVKHPEVRHPEDESLRPINPFRAMLLKVWGPADSWDNPLTGTKYDPVLKQRRQHEDLEFRRHRWEERKEHWDERLHGHHPESS
jgi:hypothetical protein